MEKSKPCDIDAGLKRLAEYGLRRGSDFDKYIALTMADELVAEAKTAHHKEANFLKVAAKALRDRFDEPLESFQSYFLALFGDKDYVRVLEKLTKVQKAAKAKVSPKTQGAPKPPQPGPSSDVHQPMICFYCGVPGHIASFCFKKKAARFRGRYAPYPQRGRGRAARG